MAIKRKHRKLRINPVVSQPHVTRLKPRGSDWAAQSNAADIPDDLLDNAALPESHASGLMLVITIASLLFIGFIVWCVSQMPAK